VGGIIVTPIPQHNNCHDKYYNLYDLIYYHFGVIKGMIGGQNIKNIQFASKTKKFRARTYLVVHILIVLLLSNLHV